MSSESVFKVIATLGPIGYIPIAPGTAASAVSCLLYIILKPDTYSLITVTLLLFIIGTTASTRTEAALGEKDSSSIVIDEFAGYPVSVFWIPFSPEIALLSFLLFRVFDILKPPPIRYVERRLRGGFGVMFDDILAGLYTNLLLRLLIMLK